jgi:hypothetical protein
MQSEMKSKLWIGLGLLAASSAQAATLRCDIYNSQHQIAMTRVMMTEPSMTALTFQSQNPQVHIQIFAYSTASPQQFILQLHETAPDGSEKKVMGANFAQGDWAKCQILLF